MPGVGRSTTGVKMNYISKVQSLADTFTDELATGSPDGGEWLKWLGYLLETLQEKTPERGVYERILATLNEAISQRLKLGRW